MLDSDDTSFISAQALAAVRGLLDPTDERYEAQQGLAAAGALAALASLIGDASEAVSADAAHTTEQLLRHSSVVTARCGSAPQSNSNSRCCIQSGTAVDQRIHNVQVAVLV